MNTQNKIFTFIILPLFILHFFITILYLIAEPLHLSRLRKFTGHYILPLFEQNWNMFSVPGKSNKQIVFQYRLCNSKIQKVEYSGWVDVTRPLREFNKQHFFSISQRLMKYSSACINDIYQVANRAIDSINKNTPLKSDSLKAADFIFRNLKTKSLGYASLKHYARKIYLNTPYFPKSPPDSIAFSIKIIDDAFPEYESRQKDMHAQNNHNYSAFTIAYGDLFR